MIANISIDEKSFGDKILYEGLSLQLQAKKKVGAILYISHVTYFVKNIGGGQVNLTI